MKLIVYIPETDEHVATITGETNEECERVAKDRYGSNDYSWTYSPAWGMASGLEYNANAEEIAADEE